VNPVGVGGWFTREKGRVTLRMIFSTRQGKVRILAPHMDCTATPQGSSARGKRRVYCYWEHVSEKGDV